MNELSPTMQSLVDDELATGRDPRAIARALGLTPAQVRPDLSETAKFSPISTDGWGRKDLRQYIVSRRSAYDASWPDEDADKIALMRVRYDAGESEVCQGRDGTWFVLYEIPRKKKIKREPYLTVSNFGEG